MCQKKLRPRKAWSTLQVVELSGHLRSVERTIHKKNLISNKGGAKEREESAARPSRFMVLFRVVAEILRHTLENAFLIYK